MKAPSSRHLSHDFPAYKGLTLHELLRLIVVVTMSVTLLFVGLGLLLGWPVGFGCLGFVLGFIVSISCAPKPIARYKSGKPHGYVMKRLNIQLATWGITRAPYVKHVGIWQKSRRIGG